MGVGIRKRRPSLARLEYPLRPTDVGRKELAPHPDRLSSRRQWVRDPRLAELRRHAQHLLRRQRRLGEEFGVGQRYAAYECADGRYQLGKRIDNGLLP